MKKLIIGIILTILVAGCIKAEEKDEKIVTPPIPPEEIEPEATCTHDSDCNEGHACYNSQYCAMTPTGAECDDQMGDLLCHKKCATDSDCPLDLTCESVEITKGDAIHTEKMCMDTVTKRMEVK